MPGGQPLQDNQTPSTPAGVLEPFVFESFEGMNTTTTRPGVDDKEAAWLDGFMPLGPGRNMRTMPDTGVVWYDNGTPNRIVFFAFANIGATPYAIVFLIDGYVVAINMDTGSGSVLAGIGTITNPSRLNIGVASYGNQYVLIVARQTNGYFIWDGTTFYTPGAAGPGGGTMPSGIGGTAIEVYAGRIWIANSATIYYSAPGSLVLFGSSGGGNFTSSDSFLRVNFIELKQSNGFLYLVADSSINYISGVSTSGSPAVTTFTNQNLDPEVGTPWPGTVGVLNRNIVFANSFGVHISYGGAVSKISEKLDGVYNTVTNFGSFVPSAAKANLYGKKIWVLLLPIIDPITGQQATKFFCWNGKIWWAASQSRDVIFIATQEINSVLTAWGTDGQRLFSLFQTPSDSFTKIAQSKLWDRPGYEFYKYASRFFGVLKYYSNVSPDLTISIDNETDQATNTSSFNPLTIRWFNNTGADLTWKNSSNVTIVWYSSGAGFTIIPPDAVGQNGTLIGMTITTDAEDMAIVSMKITSENMAYRG